MTKKHIAGAAAALIIAAVPAAFMLAEETGTTTPSGLQIAELAGTGSGTTAETTAGMGVTIDQLMGITGSRKHILIKQQDDPTIYYVSPRGIKMPIVSAKVFLSYGNKWEDVAQVDDEEFNSYQDCKYIRLQGNGAIYYLKDAQKRYITQKAASELGILQEEVIDINRTEFNTYTTGAEIKTAADVALGDTIDLDDGSDDESEDTEE